MKKMIVAVMMFVGMSTAAAADHNDIKLLTDRSDVHITQVAQDFESQTGVGVNITFVDKGIIEKAQSGDYDIIITKNSSEIVVAKQNGMLHNIHYNVLHNIPMTFKDTEDQQWFLMSYRIRAFHIRNGVEDVPDNYEALALPQYAGRICTRSLTHNYNLELFGTMLGYMGEDKFTEWFKGFKSNLAREPHGNDRNQVKGVYEGVCDIAIANTYYRGLMLENDEQKPWADNTFLYIPNQHYSRGAIALYAGVGALSDNENNDAFFQFLISDDVQQGLSEHNYEYPILSKNTSETVQMYGDEQGLNHESIRLFPNIQNRLFELRKQAYLIVKSN